MKLELSGLKFSLSESHPNKMIITGSITEVGKPSDGIPCGAEKRVVWTNESAEKNHKTFCSMPVNCTSPDWWGDGTDVFTGHGDINIGVIEDTWIEDSSIMAKIIVWKNLFPDISYMIRNGQDALGFSVECYPDETHEDDQQDGFLYIDKFTGTGCALLWKNEAAFQGTCIKELAASRKVDDKVNKEELQGMFDSMFTKFEEKIIEVKASVDAMKADITASDEKIAEIKASVDASTEVTKNTIEEIKTSVVKPPAPTTQQSVLPNGDLTKTTPSKADRIAVINASANMDMTTKIREITKINMEQESTAE